MIKRKKEKRTISGLDGRKDGEWGSDKWGPPIAAQLFGGPTSCLLRGIFVRRENGWGDMIWDGIRPLAITRILIRKMPNLTWVGSFNWDFAFIGHVTRAQVELMHLDGSIIDFRPSPCSDNSGPIEAPIGKARTRKPTAPTGF